MNFTVQLRTPVRPQVGDRLIIPPRYVAEITSVGTQTTVREADGRLAVVQTNALYELPDRSQPGCRYWGRREPADIRIGDWVFMPKGVLGRVTEIEDLFARVVDCDNEAESWLVSLVTLTELHLPTPLPPGDPRYWQHRGLP